MTRLKHDDTLVKELAIVLVANVYVIAYISIIVIVVDESANISIA
jgi:hypothetical protein